MTRRAVLHGIIASAAIAALEGCFAPRVTSRSKPARLGLLTLGPSSPTLAPLVDAFVMRLRELGHLDGETIYIDWRHPDGRPEHIAQAAAALVGARPDVIAVNYQPGAVALRDATRTIPVVFWNSADPVSEGLVADLARPEGNLTGIADTPGGGMYAKRVQLLSEAVPAVYRMALISRGAREPARLLSEVEDAARTLDIRIERRDVQTPTDVDAVLAVTQRPHVDAIYVMPSAIVSQRHAQIADHALKSGLPSIHGGRAFVEAGGLMSYGSNALATYKRAAALVDRVLRGAKPAEIPVEGNTKFDLVINMGTARRLALAIPASVLAQAAEVIQ